MVDEQRVIRLLGRGVTQREVALAVGCTEGYISQLLAREDIASQVSAGKLQMLQGATERDEGYERIEDKLIAKLESSVELMFKPREIAQTLAMVNATKRRGSGAPEVGTQIINNNLINLTLPNVTMQKYTTSPQGEVVEVDGKPLVTIGARQLMKQLQTGASDVQRIGTEADVTS